ncbi:MAG: sulfite exporter TauE/SafE family protein [Spirochaetia bacterium]|jgi:Na+-translocating ferredoxin:NAD+ oxidoreductase RnfG subunit
MSQFLGSVGLGFSVSLSCAFTCLPVYLPFSVTAEGGRDWGRVGMLLVGRLAAYLLMGAIAGALGSAFSTSAVSRLSAIAIIPLSVLLFLRASGVFTKEIRICGVLNRLNERIRSPLLVGFLLGFSICYPFLIVIAVAAAAGGPVGGMVVFAGFFLGTSAFLAPLFLLPLVRRAAFRDWLGRASAVIAAVFALVYLAKALMILLPQAHLPPVVTQADVEKLFPGAITVELAADASPRYYRVYAGSETGRTLAGYAVSSMECAPDIRGYAGPLPLLLALDPEGRILGVTVLPNDETPSYVSWLFSADCLARYAGKSYRDPFQIGSDVDAVSGATVSQEALARTMQATLRVFATKVLRQEPVNEPHALPRLADFRLAAFAAMAALSIAVLFFGRRLRLWFLGFTVICLGLVFGFFLSISDIVRLLFGVASSPVELVPRLALMGIALALTVAFGRHYCSLLCPYGALQELLYAASPFKRPVSPQLDTALRAGKYVLLLAVPVLFAFSRDFSVLAFEPFDATFHAIRSPEFLRGLLTAQFPLFLFLVVLLLANLVTERFYCKYLCPVGALFSLLSVARLFPRQRFMVPGRTCEGCSKGKASFESECFACGGRKT